MTGAYLQSVLTPAGVQALEISRLWWLMLTVVAVVFVGVVLAVAAAVRKARAATPAVLPLSDERTLGRGVAIATGATVVVLFGLLVASAMTGRAVQSLGETGALTITVTGNQWWWNVEYDTPVPAERVRTANEIHVPVGRVVRIALASNDVIHSFWVPNLSGKIDLIPGRQNALLIRAEQAGTFRGQCAEFCGTQHAHMAIVVVAEAEDVFNRWLSAQREPAAEPAGAEAVRGKALVEHGSCAMCHAIAGTIAGARTAPDLTHVASRRTIAAGTLPNTPEDMAAWIANPHQIKPGTKMPATGLGRGDVQAIVSYLETLK